MKKSKEIKLRNLIRRASKKEVTSEALTTSAASGKKVGSSSSSSSRSQRRSDMEQGIGREYSAQIPPGTTAAYPVADTRGRGRKARITSRAGYRGRIKTTRGGAGGGEHGAYDFSARIGTPIVAYADGSIVKTNRGGDGGNAITISHPGLNWTDGDRSGSVKTYYAHLSEFVKNSGPVKAGEIIGLSGDTGNVSGPHLHWSIFIGGESVKNDDLYDAALANAVVINATEVGQEEDDSDSDNPLAESMIRKKKRSLIESKIRLSSFVKEDRGLTDLERLIDDIVKKEIMKERLGTRSGKRFGGGRTSQSDSSSESEDEDVTSATGDAVAIASAEVAKWQGKDESDEDMQDELAAYAAEVGQGADFFPDQPWSAGFISFAKKNEPGFKKSASHSTYMRDAKSNRDTGKESGHIAYQPSEQEPDPGDLVCRPREGDGDGWDNIGSQNHCDVYVGNNKMAGGNLGDTAKFVRYRPRRATMIIKTIAEDYGLSEDEMLELENILIQD